MIMKNRWSLRSRSDDPLLYRSRTPPSRTLPRFVSSFPRANGDTSNVVARDEVRGREVLVVVGGGGRRGDGFAGAWVHACNGGASCTRTMQLMTLNSLLMFDLVFLFFLFLVGVSCFVYYLPGTRTHAFAPHEIITARTSPRYDAPIDNV